MYKRQGTGCLGLSLLKEYPYSEASFFDISKKSLEIVKINSLNFGLSHRSKFVNLDWRDGWHGETLFYNPDNLKEIVYTSLYIPGRIILFDGSIPHAIRPQSVKAPKFRFTLSLFFD